MLPLISSRRVTFHFTFSFEISCARLWHCGRSASGRPHPGKPRARHDAGRSPHHGGERVRRARIEGLIQGHVGRGTFIKGNGNGLKITPPAPPVLNGNEGVRWELLFADERGEEVLSRLNGQRTGRCTFVCNGAPGGGILPN